jgi:hypothetical protein
MYVEWHLVALVDMSIRLLRFPIQIRNGVLVKGVALVAVEDMVEPGRVSQAKDAISMHQNKTESKSQHTSHLSHLHVKVMSRKADRQNVRRMKLWRAHYGNAFRHHDLIARVGVQVPRAHKARLRGMRMDPANHHEVLAAAVVKHGALVLRLARVRRALLVRDEEAPDEEGVVNRRPAQHAAHLEPGFGVVPGDVQKGLPELPRQEHGADRVAVFQVPPWFEGEAFLSRQRRWWCSDGLWTRWWCFCSGVGPRRDKWLVIAERYFSGNVGCAVLW